MDERLQKALEFSNYTATLNNQKKNIKNRVQQIQTVHYNNGIFIADQITISFVSTLINLGNKTAIIQDKKENPINIQKLSKFLEELVEAYTSAMIELESEYEKLKKARNIKKIMDW